MAAQFQDASKTPHHRQHRDELIVDHLPLVTFILNRINATVPAHVDRDDLRSAGILGLISAADRFDPARGFSFKTFAEPRIRGMVLDHLRSEDWLPRTLRTLQKQMNSETSLLAHRMGRNPTGEEIAEAMGLHISEY